MVERNQKPLLAVLLVGGFYCLIGISFGLFAAWSSSFQGVFAWRLASFIVCAIAFALHIGYEHFRLRTRPLILALRTAVAVALGAFLLAVSAHLYAIGVATANHRMLAFSLGIWPAMTGIPAFVVAMIAAWGLTLVRR